MKKEASYIDSHYLHILYICKKKKKKNVGSWTENKLREL